ncbi:MAG: crosslink repair DNA glycosylase YcaQ family protein, partial [Anaerolineaceae bacterium]
MPVQLTLPAARNMLLTAQGLLQPPTQPTSKAHVLSTIRQIGILQIDTINVVARSPYMVLWSRLGDYQPAWLDELLAEGALFEYWAHGACFIPIEDYPLFRGRMLKTRATDYSTLYWSSQEHVSLVQRILERIRLEGPLRSSDFESDHEPLSGRPQGGWWNWKDEKRGLEHLFNTGELMIARREKFQRVYDLQERVLPGWDDRQTCSEEDVRRALVLKTVSALGISRIDWVAHYYYLAKTGLTELVKGLAREGALLEVEVEGWPEPAYVHPDQQELLNKAASGALEPALTTLLSPFDPLILDRRRTRQVFGFDFTIECYLPQAKRRYGYYALPILHRGALVGRLAAKAHRAKGIFEVKGLWLEPGWELKG